MAARGCVSVVCVGGWLADFFAVVNAYFECFSLYMLECMLIILYELLMLFSEHAPKLITFT